MSLNLNNLNLFFAIKSTYFLDENIENVHSRIQVIASKKWSDLSENITGTINLDNTFKFTHQWSLTYIRWFENSPAYLTGDITNESNKTKLSISTRPNSGFILMFYVFIILFLYKLFTIQTPDRNKLIELATYSILIFTMYIIMKVFIKGIDRRFKRILKLNY